MAKQQLPETEYHVVKVTGHGYKFMPAKVQVLSRMERRTMGGYIVGVVMIWGKDVKFRTVDLNNQPHPDDRVFELGEEPTLEECDKIIPRLQKAFPMMKERILIVGWEDGRFGKPRQFLELAPEGFEIPTVSSSTMPENTAKEEPASEHLTATIGESTKLSRKKQRKLALQTQSET